MIRLARITAFMVLLLTTAPAQDAPSPADELRELRKAVEEQSRKIAALTEQIAKLTAALENKPTPAPETAPAKEEFSTASAPKADPAVPHHIVVKGETLTSIAKHYNVPLAELMKANKGLDERKLQIGQTVLLPTPPQTPATPKPNP